MTIAWQLLVVITTCMTAGFLMGATVFYPIGRRHGFKVALEHWEKMHALTTRPIRRSTAFADRAVKDDGSTNEEGSK